MFFWFVKSCAICDTKSARDPECVADCKQGHEEFIYSGLGKSLIRFAEKLLRASEHYKSSIKLFIEESRAVQSRKLLNS